MSFYTEVLQPHEHFHNMGKMNDPNLLEPVTRAAVQAIIADAAEMGIVLIAFETYRSAERQQHLFATGATKLQHVGVHHYGLACDLVVTKDGNPTWEVSYDFLRDLAKKHGMIWGGDWGTPQDHHSFIDADHVQRCTIADQNKLFLGEWYPGENYNPVQ